MSTLPGFLFYWGPFLFYSALILAFSSVPVVPAAQQAPDKLLHFVEYTLYAYLLWRGMTRSGSSRLTMRHSVVILLAGAAYGALDEFYQSFIPRRSSSIEDWYADVAGTLAMITFILIKDRYRGSVTRVI